MDNFSKIVTNRFIIVVGVLLLITGIIITSISMFKLEQKVNNSGIELITYKQVSTSIDENNRLHILFYSDDDKYGKTLILSDTLTLGIYSQISNVVYKDYIQKQKGK